jgi:hypothetical protein
MSSIPLPPGLRVNGFSIQPAAVTRAHSGPFGGGGAEAVVDLLQDRWRASFSTTANTRAESGAVEAWLAAQRGGANTTPLHHFARPYPLGTLGRQHAVYGLLADAAQGANEVQLATVPGATLLAGDMVGVSGLLLQCAADCVADGQGVITVPLVNRLRRALTGLRRASTGTFVDSAGVLQTAAVNAARFTYPVDLRNLLRWSSAFANASVWNSVAGGVGDVAPVITDAAAPGVDGLQTASLVVFNSASGPSNSSVVGQSVAVAASVPPGATCISRFWVRAATPADVGKIIFHRHVAGAGYVAITLTDSWQLTGSTEVSIGGSFDIGLRPSLGSSSGQVSVLIDGAQLELGSVRTAPRATGPQPRLSASPVLLAEAAGTNLIRQSQALNIAPWGLGTVAVAAAAETYRGAAPFWTLAKTLSSGSEFRGQDFGAVTAGQPITLTLALLAGSVAVCGVGLYDNPGAAWGLPADSTAEVIEGPGAVARVTGALFDVSGLSATIPTVVRITRTYQAATAQAWVVMYPGSATSTTIGQSVKATRVQVETGTAATSYIPTTTTAATRAADVMAPAEWNKPTRPFRLASRAGVRHAAGYAEGLALDFVEDLTP